MGRTLAHRMRALVLAALSTTALTMFAASALLRHVAVTAKPPPPLPPSHSLSSAPTSSAPTNVRTTPRRLPTTAAATRPSLTLAVERRPQEKKFCDDVTCIFDIGHNSGQDTAYYLSPHGHPPSDLRIVAVDANPALMRRSAAAFSGAVRARNLTLVTSGLVSADAGTEPSLSFFINTINDKFSSFDEELGCRDAWGRTQPVHARAFCDEVRVPQTTCGQLVERFGRPTYVKIDIEGRDLMCLRSLASLPASQRPTFVSIENVNMRSMRLLTAMGFNRFKAVDQLRLQQGAPPGLRGYSGPWGDRAEDVDFGRQWVSADKMLSRMPLPDKRMVGGRELTIWYDLHASAVS